MSCNIEYKNANTKFLMFQSQVHLTKVCVKNMIPKLLCGVLALVAFTKAASISGSAGIDPSQVFIIFFFFYRYTFKTFVLIWCVIVVFQAFIGGRVTFPQIPGVNSPLFGWFDDFIGGFGGSADNNKGGFFSDTGSPFGPFASFLRQIPILNFFVPDGHDNNLLPSFPSFPELDSVLDRLAISGNGGVNHTGNYSLPIFSFPSTDQGPYVPGLSEALETARRDLKIALNVTADLSTGLRDAIAIALDSDCPADGIRVIINTIARVYCTVAANCPVLVVGARVFNEGVRLAGEVARSVVHVFVGSEHYS